MDTSSSSSAAARKKKLLAPDQVTDEQGRRRFHGAFTGGFSAGHYNTVGSVEGWAPQTFVSSR
jgi:G patch domain-containing protein 1